MPIVIKDPGRAWRGVDEHLKRFGHMPNTDLCDKEGTCVRKFSEVWAIADAAIRAHDAHGGFGLPKYLCEAIENYREALGR